ncbi:MAG: cell division protein FtsZ, partial [Clostridium baratii]|nr:cell division protein FtsZ [Clostridium baratii]
VYEAADVVREAADPDANIIFGAVIDETLQDEIRITVIATGFEEEGLVSAETKEANKIEVKTQIKQKVEEVNESPKEEVAATEVEVKEEVPAFTEEDLSIPTFLRRPRRSN